MPNIMKWLGTCFLIVSTFAVSGILILYNSNAHAQVDKNTLESVFANQTRSAQNDVAQINLVGSPGYLFDASAYNKLYVTNSLNDDDKNGTVSVIDTTNYAVTRNIPVGVDPKYIFGDLSASPFIYVANWNSQSDYANGTVSVIDTRTDSVVENITVGVDPKYIYGDLSESPLIYVVNSLATGTINNVTKNAVNVIDTSNNNTIVKNISITSNSENKSIASSPTFILVDPTSKLVYVAENNYFENNSVNGTVSVLSATNDTLLKRVPVGIVPRFIFKSPESRDVYVANFGSNTVSVIDGRTYKVTNIPVEDSPENIYGRFASKDSIHPDWMDYIYVTYSNLDRISVISTWDNRVVQNLPAESNRLDYDWPPPYVHLPGFGHAGYFTNYGSNTTSVFDRMNSSVIKNITVGLGPEYISGGQFGSDAIYVVNSISSGVSLINSVTNEVVSRVTFDIIPSTVGQARTGNIVCNGIETPLDQFFYISSGSNCIAKPSKGFEFASWVENLGGNLTRTNSSGSGYPWTAFLDTINLKPDDPAATLTVNRFGNFTAYFRALPPAIPSEYLAPLYAIVVSTVVGLSIPSIIAWRKSKKQTSRLNSYHQEMTSLYADGKLDESDTEHLNLIKKNIINAYSEGKINNEQYTNLKEEISALYEEIYRKRLDAIKDSSSEDVNRTVVIEKIQEDIKDAYSKGKISELHYNLLNEKITKMTSKSNSK